MLLSRKFKLSPIKEAGKEFLRYVLKQESGINALEYLSNTSKLSMNAFEIKPRIRKAILMVSPA